MKTPLSNILLTILLLSNLATAFDPKEIGSANYEAQLSWIVDFGNVPIPNEATLTVYAVPNTKFQKVVYSSQSQFEKSVDEQGNEKLNFKFKPSGQSQTITLNAFINVSYDPSTTGFALAREEEDAFLQESRLVTITPEIRAIAQNIAGNTQDQWEKYVLLTEWVHENIEYDLDWKSFAAGSVETLKAKRGTCDEMAHLLLALLRSQNIQSRLIVGYVFNGEKWGPHAWIEAIIDKKWVPSDPTFAEVGALDATHVGLAKGRDQDDTRFEIIARGYDLDLSKTTVEPEANFKFTQSKNFSKFYRLEVEHPENFRDALSKETIKATVSGTHEQVAIPLTLSLYEEFKLIGKKTRIVPLKQGEETPISWDIVYPEKMDEGYYYNYSAAIHSMGNPFEFYLKGKKGAQKNVEEGIKVTDFRAFQREGGVTITIILQNTGNTQYQNASISLETQNTQKTENFNLQIGAEKRFDYYLRTSPQDELVDGEIIINAGNTKTLQPFTVTIEKLKVPTPPEVKQVENATKDVSAELQQVSENLQKVTQNLPKQLQEQDQETLLAYLISAIILTLTAITILRAVVVQ
ncbi:MAG: transglutaminase family protein [Candidatus Micrarchaeia archaeon]